MTARKLRLTVTIDAALVRAGGVAVAAGQAESLSGWVNQALAERVAKEKRLRAMAEAVALYESEHGVISDAELVAQARADRRAAVVVRGAAQKKARRARGR